MSSFPPGVSTPWPKKSLPSKVIPTYPAIHQSRLKIRGAPVAGHARPQLRSKRDCDCVWLPVGDKRISGIRRIGRISEPETNSDYYEHCYLVNKLRSRTNFTLGPDDEWLTSGLRLKKPNGLYEGVKELKGKTTRKERLSECLKRKAGLLPCSVVVSNEARFDMLLETTSDTGNDCVWRRRP